jgi:hypothetical protein
VIRSASWVETSAMGKWSARALVGAGVVLVAGCVGPARTYDDYRLKATSSVETARSAVGTAQLAVRVADERRAFTPYVVVLVSEAEEDAGSAQQSFDSIQPPNTRADALRSDVDDLLTAATDVLATLRIEARRGHLDELVSHARELDGVARDLDRFTEEHA